MKKAGNMFCNLQCSKSDVNDSSLGKDYTWDTFGSIEENLNFCKLQAIAI